MDRLVESIEGVFEIYEAHWDGERGFFVGKILIDSAEAFEVIQSSFSGLDYIPHIRMDDGRTVLMAIPKRRPAKERSAGIHLALFIATLLCTLMVGAIHRGVDVFASPGSILLGWRFALGLLLVLGSHEMGHYYMARRHGVEVTLPYFIPMPALLGTLGAFISVRSPIPHRKALFDIGLAGPLASLLTSIPLLYFGWLLSPVPFEAVMGLDLYALGKSPLLLVGWIGILVTAFNLLPVGNLDGGHVIRAMLGEHHGTFSMVTLTGLLIAGVTLWPGLLLWGAIISFFGLRHEPPLDDISTIGWKKQVIGWLGFILILAPILGIVMLIM